MNIIILLILIIYVAQGILLHILNKEILSLRNSNSELYKQNKLILENISVLYEDIDVDMITLKSEVNDINTRCTIVIDTLISELNDKRESSRNSTQDANEI